jgi:hypothetical protein
LASDIVYTFRQEGSPRPYATVGALAENKTCPMSKSADRMHGIRGLPSEMALRLFPSMATTPLPNHPEAHAVQLRSKALVIDDAQNPPDRISRGDARGEAHNFLEPD